MYFVSHFYKKCYRDLLLLKSADSVTVANDDPLHKLGLDNLKFLIVIILRTIDSIYSIVCSVTCVKCPLDQS